MINTSFKFEGKIQNASKIIAFTRNHTGRGRHNIRNTLGQVYLKKVHLAQIRLTLFDLINRKEKLRVLKAPMLVLPTETFIQKSTYLRWW